MFKKRYLVIFALVICSLISVVIQKYSGRLYQEPIVKIEQVTIEEGQQIIEGKIVNGDNRGAIVDLHAPYQENEIEYVHLQPGDQVFYRNSEVLEKKRDGLVFFVISLLLLTLLFIGGKTGLTTFLSVVLNSLALYFMIWFYRTYSQFPLVQVTLGYMVFAVAVTLFLIDGIQKNSLKKFLSTLVTILLAFSICYFSMELFNDRGLRFEDMGVLTRPYRPIFLTSLLIGAIGASLDTVVTVISTLEEIEKQNSRVSMSRLIQSGRVVGKDISGTMINVLVCSYLSSSIPMILLYLFNGWSFFQTINTLLSLEMVRILCGGFGILFSIPVALGFFYLGRTDK
ncbi:YibE/F family protein [Enterococcus olivae]